MRLRLVLYLKGDPCSLLCIAVDRRSANAAWFIIMNQVLQRPNKLTGKRALVTAGGQGIGRAIAEGLLRSGCKVAIHTYQSNIDVGEMGERTGCEEGALRVFRGDLRDRDEVNQVVANCVEWLGGMDILINNAGSLIGRRQLFEVDEAFLDESIRVNVGSMLWVTQASAAALEEAGSGVGASVVNLASLAGRKGGHAGSLVYSGMKGAVLTLTRSLATEWGPKGIRVNAVAPGLILGSKFHEVHTTEDSARKTISGIPLGRAGGPDDVARAVVYLASEFDGFISGSTLDINGAVYAC